MYNNIFRRRTFNRFCCIFPIWYIWATGAFVPASLYKVDWLVYQFNIKKNHFRLLCIISSLLLCILSASRLPILVCTACYTNLYVPFSRLNAEILAPLEQEIRGLQQFRQPTSVIFMVDFINTEIFSTRRSWRRLDQRVQCVWMWCTCQESHHVVTSFILIVCVNVFQEVFTVHAAEQRLYKTFDYETQHLFSFNC